MKSIKNLFLSVLSIMIFAVACDFGDTNIDPDAVGEAQVTLPLILPKAEVQSVYNIAATGGRIAGIWMQYFEGVEAQQASISNYNVDESDVNNAWEFQLYVGAMRDNVTILEKATVPGARSPYYAGIARVLLAHNLSFATQAWGDIPYSEAFLGADNLTPVYDSQESIFATIQTLLDSAIVNFQANPTGVIPGGDDLFFSGDLDSWIATARSLKARNYLITANQAGNAAYTNALDQINAGTIVDVSSQPDFVFDDNATNPNPIAEFEASRASTLQGAPDFLNAILVGDPRANVYFSVDELVRFAGSGLYWGENDSPLPLISYSEVKYIESECLLMTGDITGAEEALEEAIKSNMHQVGIDSSSAAVSTYLGTNAGLAGLASQGARLDQIISEKYKSMYVQGMIEIWSDYRRTGFPSFISPFPGATLPAIPGRFVYPQSERLTNLANLDAAAANQGGAALSNSLWAFQ